MKGITDTPGRIVSAIGGIVPGGATALGIMTGIQPANTGGSSSFNGLSQAVTVELNVDGVRLAESVGDANRRAGGGLLVS